MTVEEKEVASRWLFTAEVAGRVVRNDSTRASDLGKAAGIFLDDYVRENFDHGRVGRGSAVVEGFSVQHFGGIGALTFDETAIAEDTAGAFVIPPLSDTAKLALIKRVEIGAVQEFFA